MYRMGVDVGGTNTDVVILKGNKVLSSIKVTTTKDVIFGINTAIKGILSKSALNFTDISAVMIGTTHFMNAILEGRDLCKVSTIRLGFPSSSSLGPMVDWPAVLKEKISGPNFIVHGGYEFDGSAISKLDEKEIKEVTKIIVDNGIENIAVSSIFAPLNDSMEKEVENIIREICPTAKVTLSSKIGSLGLLERENSTILNGALQKLAPGIINSIKKVLENFNIKSKVFLIQNDGTLLNTEYVEQYPILTISSGSANSMRGAAFLSNINNAVVLDIGGTSTDAGMLINGFPREAMSRANIAGVKTNFRVSDTISIGLGGGSIIRNNNEVGPESVGYNLQSESMIFGGNVLTTTDIAVASGHIELGDKSLVKHISQTKIREIKECIKFKLEGLFDKVKTSSEDIPLLIVGGGAILVKEKLKGSTKMYIPEYYEVANAIGAAIAEISGEIDQIFCLEKVGGRKQALDIAIKKAEEKALFAGADKNTLKVNNIEEIHLPYLPGDATRIKVKVTGDLKF